MRKHLSYANAMATVAVFITLGGSSYAATKITGKQIKDGSIAKRDLSRAVREQLAKAGVPGPKGDTGPRGETGAQGGAGQKGDQGDAGKAGTDGLGVTDDQTLPSGDTLVGTFSATSPMAAGTAQLTAADVSFRPKLAAPIPDANIHYINGSATEACPGTAAEPAAAAGHLCIYQSAAPNMAYVGTFPIDDNNGDGASTRGAIVFFNSDNSVPEDPDPRVWGVWAVTAP